MYCSSSSSSSFSRNPIHQPKCVVVTILPYPVVVEVVQHQILLYSVQCTVWCDVTLTKLFNNGLYINRSCLSSRLISSHLSIVAVVVVASVLFINSYYRRRVICCPVSFSLHSSCSCSSCCCCCLFVLWTSSALYIIIIIYYLLKLLLLFSLPAASAGMCLWTSMKSPSCLVLDAMPVFHCYIILIICWWCYYTRDDDDDDDSMRREFAWWIGSVQRLLCSCCSCCCFLAR